MVLRQLGVSIDELLWRNMGEKGPSDLPRLRYLELDKTGVTSP